MSTPHLLLNGTGSGTISNVTVPTMIAPERSPDDRHLVSVSIIGTDDRDVSEVESQTRSELQAWFGAAVETWTLLTMQRIPNALPHQPSELLAIPERNVEFGPGLWVCGDHRDQSSIQGALRSGARTAAGILSRAESAAGGGAKQAG
jgi:protoporphyrinogen oxidase